MVAQPPSATPTSWNNQEITLYHGTLHQSAQSILQNGVSLVYATNPDVDFGLGFYTTTLKRQAEAWASRMVNTAKAQNPSVRAGVVEFTVSRDSLARLDGLWFVRGDFNADDFWSLIFHCRSLNKGHGRSVNNGWYDVVVGPVAAFWQQRVALQGYDQVSFHTSGAITALNSAQMGVQVI